MPDAKDFAPNNPVHQKESRQPPLRELSVRGRFKDDMNLWVEYLVTGYYHDEEGGGIRVIEHKLLLKYSNAKLREHPAIGATTFFYWILAPAIQEELKITGTIHFDQKLEI